MVTPRNPTSVTPGYPRYGTAHYHKHRWALRGNAGVALMSRCFRANVPIIGADWVAMNSQAWNPWPSVQRMAGWGAITTCEHIQFGNHSKSGGSMFFMKRFTMSSLEEKTVRIGIPFRMRHSATNVSDASAKIPLNAQFFASEHFPPK